MCTILQGPTFEFTKKNCLLLQPTQIPFKDALRSNESEKKKNNLNSRKNEIATQSDLEKSDDHFDDMPFSSDSEDSVTVNGSDFDGNLPNKHYISASTDSDVSEESDYSTNENSEDLVESHMGKDHVTRMT